MFVTCKQGDHCNVIQENAVIVVFLAFPDYERGYFWKDFAD